MPDKQNETTVILRKSDYNYYLPEELIAQTPAEKRDMSRLLVLDRETGTVTHRHFCDICDYLKPGDALVLRFMGLKGRFGTTAFTFQEELKGRAELYNSCAIITDGRFSGGTSGLCGTEALSFRLSAISLMVGK